MTASDTAFSESDTGWPEGEPGWPASDASRPDAGHGEPAAWPEPDRATSSSGTRRSEPRPRPEAYRHLWQPPGRRPPPRQAIGQPYVWDGGEAASDGHGPVNEVADEPRRPARRRQPRPDALTGPALTTERAVIGELLRELAAWCQIGSCIARHTDRGALGESDIRNKAVAAGWCVDLFGRMVCPDCQQRYPVWSARPPAERGRYKLTR